MPEFDFRIFEHTDPRMAIQPEVQAALMASDRSDRFHLRTVLSGAFADPSTFLRDESAQRAFRAFLDLVGYDRARQLMRTFRLFGTANEVSLSDVPGGGRNPLNAILAFSPKQVKNVIDIDPESLPSIIRRLRIIAYERRETGLPRNVLHSTRIDFVQGCVEVIGDRCGEELDLDRVEFPDVLSVQEEESLEAQSMFAPDVGVRILGERQLAIVANEILRVLSRVAGEERRVDYWPYRRSIEALINAYGAGDTDATPFIKETLDQLMDEGVLAEGQEHLILATYHDFLQAHLDRKLCSLAEIVPNRRSKGTIDGMMRSLMLALDSSAVPVEIRDDTELVDTFLLSRARLKDLLGKNESLHVVREVVGKYLNLYDDKGLVWFLGQTLPLVALFSDPDSLRQNGIDVVQAFSPNAHYGWNSYATVMEQVRSVIDPEWDDPDGGERMAVVGADMPELADSFECEVSPKPTTINQAALCVRGGMLMAS